MDASGSFWDSSRLGESGGLVGVAFKMAEFLEDLERGAGGGRGVVGGVSAAAELEWVGVDSVWLLAGELSTAASRELS